MVEDVAKSYLGAILMWQSLENVRKGQEVIADFKAKLANKMYDESDVVNALRYGDYNIMGPLLRDYNPNNVAGWYGNQGYQNGRWVSINGETLKPWLRWQSTICKSCSILSDSLGLLQTLQQKEYVPMPMYC